MLRKLAEVAEGKGTEANRESQVRHQRIITFLRQGPPMKGGPQLMTLQLTRTGTGGGVAGLRPCRKNTYV